MTRLAADAADYTDRVRAIREICGLEHVAQRDDDPAISAVRSPLVEEIGRVDAAFGNTEIAGVRRVIHLSPELNILAFPHPGVLDESEVHVTDAIGPKCIAADVPYRDSR